MTQEVRNTLFILLIELAIDWYFYSQHPHGQIPVVWFAGYSTNKTWCIVTYQLPLCGRSYDWSFAFDGCHLAKCRKLLKYLLVLLGSPLSCPKIPFSASTFPHVGLKATINCIMVTCVQMHNGMTMYYWLFKRQIIRPLWVSHGHYGPCFPLSYCTSLYGLKF